MSGATLTLLNNTLASPESVIGHRFASFITFVTQQYGTALPSKSTFVAVFGRNAIILSAILLIGLLMGLGSLVWAVMSLRRHHREGGRVSAIVISLLLTDILECCVIPFVVTSLLNVWACLTGINCLASSMTFGYARQCGYCFHQLVALEGILSFRKPDGSSQLSTPPFAISFSLVVWIWGLVMVILSTVNPVISFIMGHVIGFVTFILVLVSSVITVMSMCDMASSTERRPGEIVLCVALFTLFVLNGPFIVWYALLQSGVLLLNLGFIATAIITFRLVTDPLLCALVCRKRQSGVVTDVKTSHSSVIVIE
ncbi:uncharacterized protein LOC134060369 [Sardina pilchardus]|uniref:uncharacterized protein LOC134060369 n=1 Tax=Sardina pilchardus TaxID=27697 RepID=UPI002E0E6ECE